MSTFLLILTVWSAISLVSGIAMGKTIKYASGSDI